jgi:hemoglobin/transferrin/lactoferrin receptor protein
MLRTIIIHRGENMSIESSIWIRRTAISVAVTSALLSQTVLATENAEQPETVVITGQKSSALSIEIDQDALEKMQAIDIEDIFRKEAEVSVGGGSAVAQKIYVRGLEDTLLNVSIDGATQSGYLFHHQGRISIEPELLKQVQIQAGAGDATNGPGALGGSIRFITKDPEDLLHDNERFGALLKGGYYSNNDAYKASASLYGEMTDNWSAMGNIVQSEGDNYQAGDGNEQPYTDYDQQVGFAKIVGRFSQNQKLSLSYDRRVDDGEKLHKPNFTVSKRNTAFDQKALRETSTLKYSIDPSDYDWLALETSAYFTDNHITHDGPYGEFQGGVETYGFDIRNSSLLSQNSLTYGIDYRNDVATLQNHSVANYDTDEDKGLVYGVYLQGNIPLTQTWLLSIGTRYDIYQLDDAIKQSFKNKGFSPNASLTFTPNDELSLYLSYAQAMRGVQVKETFVLDYYQNAADRKEEKAENVEFGIGYQIYGIGLSAKVYHSTIDDVVSSMSNAPIPGPRAILGNVGELKTNGVSLAANYSWESVQTSLSYSHNKVQLNDQPLTDSAFGLGVSTGDTIIADLTYQATNSLELSWNSRFVTRLTDVAEGTNEKLGYGVHDIYGHWLPLNDDSLRITLSVKNLFDKQYQDHATYGDYGPGADGTAEPGRDFRINLAWAL